MDRAERLRPPSPLVSNCPWRRRRNGGLCLLAHRRDRPGYDAQRADLESRRQCAALDLSNGPAKQLVVVGSRGLDLVAAGADRSFAWRCARTCADQTSKRSNRIALSWLACPASSHRPRGHGVRTELDFQWLALHGSWAAVLAWAIDLG